LTAQLRIIGCRPCDLNVRVILACASPSRRAVLAP
jgi:hypothetical protein